jgi:hypothetical protein
MALVEQPLSAARQRVAAIDRSLIALAALPVYVYLVAVMVAHHEPWFDEAQAWLLARDAEPGRLVSRLLGYEGTPGLWHFILMIPAKAGAPYLALNMIGAAAATAGVFVLLRFSPFPLVLKMLLPFSYYLFYQYAVVARSYTLLAVWLFSIAALYRSRERLIYPFVILLSLLASTTLHGGLVAGCIYAVHLVDIWRSRGWRALFRIHHLVAGGIFGAVLVAAVYQVRIPADSGFVSAPNNFGIQNFEDTAVGSLNDAFTDHVVISLAVLTASMIWFWRAGVLALYVLPTLAVIGVSAIRYHNLWHDGILFLIWIFALWLSLQRTDAVRREPWLRNLALASLCVVLFFQLQASYHTFKYDFRNSYTGAKEAAAYIKQNHLENARIAAVTWPALAVQPYFDHNLFENYHRGTGPAYWVWLRDPELRGSQGDIEEERPDYILYAIKFPYHENVPNYRGYEIVRYFPGALFWKDHIMEKDGLLLFRRVDAS